MRLRLVLAALLVAPTAAAEGAQVDLEVDAAQSLAAWGNVRLHATSAVLDLTNGTMGGAVSVRWTSARGYDVTERVDVLTSTGSGFGTEPPSNFTRVLPAGELRVRDCLSPCQAGLVVLPGSALAVDGLPDGPIARTTPWAMYHGMRESDHFAFRAEVGDGWVNASLAGASFRAHGTLVLFLNGPVGAFALADGEQEPYWSGVRRDVTRTVLGVPATAQEEERFIVLVLEGAEAVGTGMQAGRFSAPSVEIGAEDRLEARGATGRLSYGAVRRSFEDADVVVDGPVAGVLASGASGAPWEADFSGTATSVTVEAATVRPLPPAADSAGLVARLAALLVLLVLLAKACAWALYSRLGPRDVLGNANRRAILDALAAAPGSRPAEIARATGIHEAVVRYHLRRLRAAGLARDEDAAGATLWFANGTTSSPALDAVLARRGVQGETVRRLAAALLGFPGGATQVQVAEATGVSRRLVSYHMGRLEDAALVTKRGGRPAVFEPTPALRDALGEGRAE